MPGDQSISSGEKLLARGKPIAMKAPIRVTAELFPAFVGLINRIKKGRGIGGVDEPRDFQLSACLPNRIEPRIVNLDQGSIRVPIIESKPLEDLQSAGTLRDGVGQLLGGSLRKSLAVTGPRRRILRVAFSLPIHICEDDEAVSMS